MCLTIDQLLQQAVEAHRVGNLQDAETLYRAILKSEPKHPDANHNLGVLAVSVNKAESALPLFKIALEANPSQGQFWLSYIDALIKENQFDNAQDVLSQVKRLGLAGEKVDALETQLTIILSGQTSESSINKSNTSQVRNPSQLEVNALLEHYRAGQYDFAENLAKNIIQKYPDHQFSWKVIGALCKQTGRLDESLTANQKAVKLSPNDSEAHYNLGITLHDLGRPEEAETSYKRAISIKSDYAETHYNLGITLQELGRLKEAEASYRKAIALKPDYAEAHYNLGIPLQELGRLEEAETSFRKAIAIMPDLQNTSACLGKLLMEKNQHKDGLDMIRKASGYICFDVINGLTIN